MSLGTFDSIADFKTKLSFDELSVGRFVGFANHKSGTWTFAVCFDDEQLAILFTKSNSTFEIYSKNFSELLSKKHLSKDDFLSEKKSLSETIRLDIFYADPHQHSFYVYDLHLFDTSRVCNLNTIDLLQVVQHNLQVIGSMDEGDIVSFERGLYSHHALFTDKLRMMVTHRSGEPTLEDTKDLQQAAASFVGLPTAKAKVTEDHLIEVAGHRKINQSNALYDKLNLPRPKEEILAEAKRRVGEEGYSITTKNCQHFVGGVRNGTACSPEIQGVVTGAIAASAALACTLGTIAVASFMSRQNEKAKQIKEKTVTNDAVRAIEKK
jgi:HRAS-like suppressor 3